MVDVAATRARVHSVWRDLPEAVASSPAWWAFVATAAVRAVYLLAFARDDLTSGLVAVVLAFAVCVPAAGVMVRAYWKIFTGSDDDHPYLVAALFSVGAICLSIEAFAGLTALLWREDLLESSTTSGASIWDAEELYLWNLTDAVPLLDIADTMHWARPDAVVGPAVGVLVVLFRLAVLVPVLGLAFAGYQRCQQAALRQMRAFRVEAESEDPRPDDAMGWGDLLRWRARHFVHSGTAVVVLIVGVALLTVLCHAVIRLAIEEPSPLHEALAPLERDGITVSDRHVELGWLPGAVDMVIVVFVVAAVLYVCTLAAAVLYMPLILGSRIAQVASVVAGATLVLPICLAATAVSLSLSHLDVVSAIPAPEPGDEYGATMSWYSWNGARTAPLLDITDASGWTLTHHFMDRWNGALLITVRVALVATLLWPLGLVVTMIAHRDDDVRAGVAT